MEIAIFGAGAAGLMAAIALGARGHRCRIFERSRESHEAGMGFILMPEMEGGLRDFGARLAGIPLDGYCCRDDGGQLLHQEELPRGARGVRRRDLIAALLEALPSSDMLTFNAELATLRFDARNTAATAQLTSGGLVAADLLIAADGAFSAARGALYPRWPVSQCRVQEVVGLVNSESAARWAGNNFNKFHSLDGGLALGLLPVGNQNVIWFLQFDAVRFPPPEERADAQREFVFNLVGSWGDPIPHLLDVTDFTVVHRWRPIDADLIPCFYRGNLALVGDAAHPLSPFTSQGVSSAIADATALAEEVKDAKPGDDLAQALELYSARRRGQCAPYVAQGRELVQRFLQPLSEHSLVLPIAQS